jgi:hypothetical protein
MMLLFRAQIGRQGIHGADQIRDTVEGRPASSVPGARLQPLAHNISDFDTLRSRDSASICATSDSGNRTVSVFMQRVYDTNGSRARQRDVLDGMRDVDLVGRCAR